MFVALWGATSASANPVMVTSNADSGANTLRAAITAANASPGSVIDFAIGSGQQTITLATPLPTIVHSTTIDGTTQPGYVSSPLVEITGGTSGGLNGGDILTLAVNSDGSTIKGLALDRSNQAGITVASSSDLVAANYVGTHDGLNGDGNGDGGIVVTGSHNTIGGTSAAAGNVVGDNHGPRCGIDVSGGTDNRIEGNLIGIKFNGSGGLANEFTCDVRVANAALTRVGDALAGAGNVISGNPPANNPHGTNGIEVQGASSSGTTVEGNLIGTNPTATAAVGNAQDGVLVSAGASNIQIGGTSAAARNVISGNYSNGVELSADAGQVTVEGNYVGLGSNGDNQINNLGAGVLAGGSGSTIGGSATGAQNVISGNSGGGVSVTGPDNTLAGNIVGLNAAGSAVRGNAAFGVRSQSASNVVGGTAAGAGNFISGNGGPGLRLTGASATGNLIQGNTIGLGTDGLGYGNTADGLLIDGTASGNTIGGTVAAARNKIAGNAPNEVELAGSGDVVEGNYIGTDGTNVRGQGNGVYLRSANETLGGSASGAGNVVSGNPGRGVWLDTASATGNVIQGNQIGGDTSSSHVNDANALEDVLISNLASNNSVGGTAVGTGNSIYEINPNTSTSGKLVRVTSTAAGNSVRGNSLNLNHSDTTPVTAIDIGSPGIDASPPTPQPNIDSVRVSGPRTQVAGHMTGAGASSTYRLDFYANSNCDDNHRDGPRYLGAGSVTTDGSTAGLFNVVLSATPPVLPPSMGAERVIATATDAQGNTNELGPCPSTFGTDGPSLQLSSASYAAGEKDGSATITITRANPPGCMNCSGSASVHYTTTDGSGVAGSNYTASSGTVQVNGTGSTPTPTSFTVPVLDDGSVNGPHTFTIQLSAPVGAVVGTPDTATVTVNEADSAPATATAAASSSSGIPFSFGPSAPAPPLPAPGHPAGPGASHLPDFLTLDVGGAIVSRKLKSIHGRLRGPRKVSLVQIAVTRLGRGCVRLGSNGRLNATKARRGKRQPCPPNYLGARGTSRWSLALAHPLPPGRYTILLRARDAHSVIVALAQRTLQIT